MDASTPTRRGLLAAVSAGVCGLAGCSGGSSRREPFGVPSRTEATTGRSRPRSATPTFTADVARTAAPVAERARAGPAASCPDGVSAFDPPWVVAREAPLDGFVLSIRDGFVALGETVTCRLRNFSDGVRTTGPRNLVDVQRRGEDGWRTVFGATEGLARNSVRVAHSTGEGFTWRFPFTREGLASLDGDGALKVCGPVGPGIHRFVYYGVSPEAERSQGVDLALAKLFRVRAR